MTNTPIGPHEIAVMLGVTRQRVMQLRARADFPKPWATLATGHIWRAEDIEAWAKKDGRTVRRVDVSTPNPSEPPSITPESD